MDWELRCTTPAERARLERSLSRLSPEQVAFVRDALQCGRAEGRLPVQEFNLLEGCFETWWAQGSATKMAVLALIAELSDSTSWLTNWKDDESYLCPTGESHGQAGTLMASEPFVS